MVDDYEFAVCLSHDLDRVYKTYQYLFEAMTEFAPQKLIGYVAADNPYWMFQNIMDIESELGVRSSFHILDEIPLKNRPKSEWLTKKGWQLFAGRYNIRNPKIASTLRTLDRLGWEIALHGSYTSSNDPERFSYEKERIESVIDTTIIGNRQHYWRINQPETWEHLQEAGVQYDLSLGSSTKIGFQHGYDLIRPFDDEFVVFPWSLMDGALMDSAKTTEKILENGTAVLNDTRDNNSVLVLDWHGGAAFNEGEHTGWASIYRRLIEKAQEMGAWVGPPGEFYRAIEHPSGTVEDTFRNLI